MLQTTTRTVQGRIVDIRLFAKVAYVDLVTPDDGRIETATFAQSNPEEHCRWKNLAVGDVVECSGFWKPKPANYRKPGVLAGRKPRPFETRWFVVEKITPGE